MQFPPDASAAQALHTIALHNSIELNGDGPVLTMLEQSEINGKRMITFDNKRGLIVAEKYLTLPTAYLFSRSGGINSKKLALTFDDGPDSVYTPQILDVLKKTNTKATFFVLGRNVVSNSDLIQREFVEGHEIGNHTFTHPDISKISERQLVMELAATNRVIETTIGKKTRLFRAPYDIDKDPDSKIELEKIIESMNLGYMAIGIDVDSEDWEKPGVETIVNNVITQVQNPMGSIIVMHDAGGSDRKQTVEALPIIIKTLKKEGYQFVTMSEFLQIPQALIMPSVPSSWSLFFDRLGFHVLAFGEKLVRGLLFFSIGVSLIRLFCICLLAMCKKPEKKLSPEMVEDLSVSVFVPAYNEANVITKTIHSLLKSRHPKSFEIIVIDDGSTDDTLEVVRKNFGHHPLVKILTQTNGGKSVAMKNALSQTQSEIIITIDADTICAEDTIMDLLGYFGNPKVGGVASTIYVGNQTNILTRWQALEYVTCQNLDRRAFRVVDAVTIVPGALGAWRRSVILEAGSFTPDTLTEDFDLTFKVKKLGYLIVYAPDSIGYTEVPDTIAAFLRQRFRWTFGTFQVLWKNRDMAFRLASKGKWGMKVIGIPNIILQYLLQFIAPLTDLLFLLALIGLGIDYAFHPIDAANSSFIIMLLSYAVYTSVDIFTALVAFLLDGREKKSLLIWLLPQRFFYRQLMYYTTIKALLSALRGQEVWWGKSQRKNTVKV